MTGAGEQAPPPTKKARKGKEGAGPASSTSPPAPPASLQFLCATNALMGHLKRLSKGKRPKLSAWHSDVATSMHSIAAVTASSGEVGSLTAQHEKACSGHPSVGGWSAAAATSMATCAGSAASSEAVPPPLLRLHLLLGTVEGLPLGHMGPPAEPIARDGDDEGVRFVEEGEALAYVCLAGALVSCEAGVLLVRSTTAHGQGALKVTSPAPAFHGSCVA